MKLIYHFIPKEHHDMFRTIPSIEWTEDESVCGKRITRIVMQAFELSTLLPDVKANDMMAPIWEAVAMQTDIILNA